MPEVMEPIDVVVDGGTILDEEVSEESKILPPYAVIILNDEFHSFEFVIETLVKTFHMKVEAATLHAKMTHDTGRSIVWTGQKETAEFWRDKIKSFHEYRSGKDLGPIGVDIEPMG